MRKCELTLLVLLACLINLRSAPLVIEAESVAGANVYRDLRASGKRCAAMLLPERLAPLLRTTQALAPGTYRADFHVAAAPVEVLHGLLVQFGIGPATRNLHSSQFRPDSAYQVVSLEFVHPGGDLSISLSAEGGSGFDGMRQSMSEAEQAELAQLSKTVKMIGERDQVGKIGEDELAAALDDLEDDPNVSGFGPADLRVLCDRIEIVPLQTSSAVVAGVDVEKIHYRPGETVQVSADLRATAGQQCELVATEISELDQRREVHRQALTLAPGARSVTFAYELTSAEFGREIEVELRAGEQALHRNSACFGVSRNVYRVGITGNGGGQDMQRVTRAQLARAMAANKANYANYFERFAWAPCDYSNLAPKTELFWSGQTQYPGSITGYKMLLEEAHRVGVKGITYGKASAGGIDGFRTFQRYPHFFGHSHRGPWTEAFYTFYLERMLANDYNLHAKPIDGGWQHWASLWTRYDVDEMVDYGAQAIIDSIDMFGWDGVRWDGHFVDNHARFLKRLKADAPEFVHGYNVAFANPGSALFTPPQPVDDFHTIAADHGLIMDESVRDWSHTNFSSGKMTPFYEAICREADYVKRIGGLPLFITFDMASNLDQTLNVLCGLAAGERYTYINSPGDFVYGKLPKFLTRFSAFIWDDTKLLADPAQVIKVGAAESEVWWQQSCWLRQLGDGHSQLLVNLVNRPGYDAFCDRVQPPPVPRDDLQLEVQRPAGAQLLRVMHLSPDLTDGMSPLRVSSLPASDAVSLPQLRLWSVVVFDYQGGAAPLFALTDPVAAATAAMAPAADAAPAAAEKPPPPWADYENVNNRDVPFEAKMKKPAVLGLQRNGRLDVHHARGAFSWLNPIESALALLGGGRYVPSWVDYVGFKIGEAGCMDEFPDSYPELLAQDVVVLDNLNAFHLGPARRVRLADFVRNGGGLLVFGGYFNLSLGADHNSYLAEMLPVRIRQYQDLQLDNAGLRLAPEPGSPFGELDWSAGPAAYTVDTSPLNPDAEVLVRAGEHPAIVARKYGEGEVICVLINPHGNYVNEPDSVPYWQWPQWPELLAASLQRLGRGYEAVSDVRLSEGDATKVTPDELALEAMVFPPKELAAKLREALVNVIDAESARTLLDAAVLNAERIEDLTIMAQIVAAATPYFSPAFAPLADKLLNMRDPYLRRAGVDIVGLAGDASKVDILAELLAQGDPPLQRSVLAAFGRLAAPSAQSAVRKYLDKGGSEQLLATTVLYQLGDQAVLPQTLKAYHQALRRRVQLKCGRRSLYDTLYGGVSFKLTPSQRRQLKAEYDRVRLAERQLIDDLADFEALVPTIDDAGLTGLVDYLVTEENPAVVALAFRIRQKLTVEPHISRLREAKLASLRLIAGGH